MDKILGLAWYTPRLISPVSPPGTLCIGIVAFESYEPDGQWKVYIGYGQGESEERDAQRILTTGMPIGSKEVACAYFPDLSPDKFRY